jgi:signal transduction histidine kinase
MDRDKLVGIVTHLVRNAQDATPADGRVKVDVAVDGHSVVCTISDTGSGMDEVFIRDRLFRPFDSTKGVHGMGVGAYQVRDIVRGAGGDIEVTSVPGRGTSFRVQLPLADSTEPALSTA